MTYVDGYLLVVPKKNVKEYIKMAKMGKKMWMKHGALDYKECKGDDLKQLYGMRTFTKVANCKPNEVPFFSFIVYKSKAHRNKVNAAVMKDPEMQKAPKKMPFNPKRMAFGGFETVVE